jgi:teichoic acid glycerol-phosphate primase
MVKEIIISCYLLSFKIVFNIFKLFPQKNKITFVISFEENTAYLYQEMLRQKIQYDIIVVSKASLSQEFQHQLKNTPIIPFETPNIINWFKSIYHISTSKYLIIDNYFAFLSAIKFKKNVQCIQIWHAAGALKKFGLEDKTVENRSIAAKKRFRKVYEKFHKVVVGSEEMADIFIRSFGLDAAAILRTGVPRTDFFYEKENHESIEAKFKQKNPLLNGKKVILYAPTFRDTQLENYEMNLDINKMYKKLKQDYVLLIKLHPAVKTNINYESLFPDFVYDFSSYRRMNDLLIISDILITDYSSIPFEFAILQKPMIFFPYDLEFYKGERGVIDNYEEEVPGPIAFETEEIIRLLLSDKIEMGLICDFSNKWNEYSDGSSSGNLVSSIIDKENL